MRDEGATVVIAGLSVRAAAESAARAGYVVTAIDAFGDLDLERWACVLPAPRGPGAPYQASAAARLARTVDASAAAYTGSFENHPTAVRVLAEGRPLWGNGAATLARVRNPVTLARTLRARGFAVPAVRAVVRAVERAPWVWDAQETSGARSAQSARSAGDAGGDRALGDAGRAAPASARGAVGPPPQFQNTAVGLLDHHPSIAPDSGVVQTAAGWGEAGGAPEAWLLKRRASGGGRGVSAWVPGAPVPRGAVLQERIDGVPGSVAFVADGRAAVPFALSRQLVGDAAFGATGFQYCGSILAPAGDAQFVADAELYAAATDLAAAVAAEFGLVGVNCLDFVARAGTPFPIEVNPRYSASMELAERAYGVAVFDAHARACGGGHRGDRRGTGSALPAFDLRAARRGARAVGKAVVYARRDVVAGDTRGWADDASVRDVPRPGERIGAGRPVCTVFGAGRDAAGCYRALVARAARVYRELGRRA